MFRRGRRKDVPPAGDAVQTKVFWSTAGETGFGTAIVELPRPVGDRLMQAPAGPFCQSCGMPLSMDEKGGGTEADGGTSTEYCSHCYQHGDFTQPDLRVDEMVERVSSHLTQMDLPPPVVEQAALSIPSLRRWTGNRG